MKRWAAFTVLLYGFALLALTVPVMSLGFAGWWSSQNHIALSQSAKIYSEWGYWLWLGVMIAGQALLLLLPLDLRQRRLSSRWSVAVPTVTAAFFLANLCFAGFLSLLCAIFKDNAFELFIFLGKLVGKEAEQNPVAGETIRTTGVAGSEMVQVFGIVLSIVAILWLVWGLVFWKHTRTGDPESLLKRLTRWLLRGSALELLIAVPSHVIVRNRGDCCAPGGTFWGITVGLSVMLMSFGPGVFFLFADRARRLQPKPLVPDGKLAEGNVTRPPSSAEGNA